MRYIKKKSLFILVGVFLATAGLVAQSAFAAGPSNNDKPGWGHGDDNHHHTGPPGHSVHPGHGDGDHDKDDKDFHKFLTAWFQFLHNHHWGWHS